MFKFRVSVLLVGNVIPGDLVLQDCCRNEAYLRALCGGVFTF